MKNTVNYCIQCLFYSLLDQDCLGEEKTAAFEIVKMERGSYVNNTCACTFEIQLIK